MKPDTVEVGVVLGSMDSSPLEFWVGVYGENLLQLDDLISAEITTPQGDKVTFYGIVDQVRKRFEGIQFDGDTLRASQGVLPVELSYAAHISVTRILPEVFVPPDPGCKVRLLSGESFQRALFFDRMEDRVPIGSTRSGEPIYANLEFLDGTRGAHASISGVSGVATKTSYATFLLYSLFHSPTLGTDATNAKALIFNVKGEDLLWLDKPNAQLGEQQLNEYQRLGLPAGPFRSVGLFAPVRKRSAVPMPDTGSRHQGIQPYCWTLRQFAKEELLRFAFVEGGDPRSQLATLILRIERKLVKAAKEGDADDPGITLEGHRCDGFDELVELLDGDTLDAIGGNTAPGTLDAFRRRMYGAREHMGHLIRGDNAARDLNIRWQDNQVTVVDIHSLHATAQMFVVGVLLKRLMQHKENQGTSRPLLFVVLDELNKYAPRSGWSPIHDVLLDIAERGRSLGVSLFGAQQTASEVERRVVANAAMKVVGRLDSAEAERGEYGFLTPVARRRATILSPGTMIVAQPEIPTPILLHFPFPCWATRQSEVAAELLVDEDPFARLSD